MDRKNKCTNTGRTHFKKGHKPWNKGLIGWTKNYKNTGFQKGHSQFKGIEKGWFTTERVSGKKNVNYGKITKSAFKKGNKIGQLGKGIKRPRHSMEKHHNWKGGVSFINYPKEFHLIKQKIRKRDGNICQLCNFKKEKREIKDSQIIGVHHIDYNKQNNSESNLITLCNICNSKVNFMREKWISYFDEKMAQILGNVREVRYATRCK